MQITTNPYNNLYTNPSLQGDSLAKNQSDDFNVLLNSKTEKNPKEDKLTYGEIQEDLLERHLNGEIDHKTYTKVHIASLTASLVEAYNIYGMDNGVNLFGKMKGIHQERLKADCANEITTEIKKDISALDNNLIGGSDINGKIPNHIYQAQKEKAKDILFEILEEIRA